MRRTSLLAAADRLRIALVLHGYPPELAGGTEHTVRSLAHALARAGHEPLLIVGSDLGPTDVVRADEERELVSGARIPVLRIHRSDLHYGHWSKALHPGAGRAFESVLSAHRPDVVHVHHWLRLSRDLVTRAARARIPSVVTLHDLSSSCLVNFRVRPSDLEFCEAALAPDPCLDCAASVYWATPWLARDELVARLAVLTRATRRELERARAVVALCDDQARTLERLLGFPLSIRTLAPSSDTHLAPVEPLPAPSDPRAPLVLGCWATLHRLKGTDVLIEAVRILCARGVPVELHLAGVQSEPDWIAALERSARGLPVHFHGTFETLTGHPVTRVHAFVAGTRARETWGVVLDEALCLRLPMVLPRFGAYASRFREGEGVRFYARGQAEALADVLAQLRARPAELERLRAALPRTETHLVSAAQNAAELVELYRAAVAAGAPEVEPADPAAEAAESAWIQSWDRQFARAQRP